MKDLANILQTLCVQHEPKLLEGILDDIDANIESGVNEDRIIKLLGKWETIISGYKYKPGTDACGNKIDVGDWVMAWGGLHPQFGKIIKTDWSVKNGSNISIINNDKPQDYYINKMTGELACNARADHCLKLDEKSVLTILKALCGR